MFAPVDTPESEMRESKLVKTAAEILKAGGLVAFPTETVYGLGADAENPDALERLYAVKGRPRRHPVIVHLASASALPDWVLDMPEVATILAEAFWPGPLTLILPRSSRVPDAVTGGQETVGIRVPAHPLALALLQEFGGGVAAPSANRFGRLSPTRAEHVRADLQSDVDMVLDGGPCAVGVESTIVAFRQGLPVILRPGGITQEQIMAVLASKGALPDAFSINAKVSRHVTDDLEGAAGNLSAVAGKVAANTISRAPGTLASHYAPNTLLDIVPAELLLARIEALQSAGETVGVLARGNRPESLASQVRWIQAETQAEGYTQQLYAQLRLLDGLGLSRILVEAVPQTDAWLAVSDRLSRAAYR